MSDDYLDKIDGRHYNRLGDAISMREYFKLLEIPGYKVVHQTKIGDYFVSTVWLGLDHGHGESVLIFETMVFDQGGPKKDKFLDLVCERYATEHQAFEGHAKIATETRLLVKLLKENNVG